MNFPQFFKNPAFAKASAGKQKFYIISSVILISGLFFLASASSVSAFAGASADKPAFWENQRSYFSSYFNPLISFVEKTIKGFGFDVSLAAAPDPDFCGGDNLAGCSGSTPQVYISWQPLMSGISFSYYILTISGFDNFNTNWDNFYTVSSGLANNVTYNWSVEAYNTDGSQSSASLGFTNQPYGSFTTPNCAPPPPPPTPEDFSLSLGGSVACNSVPLSWTASSNADGYRILRGSPRVDISPYQLYTALNFTDTTVSQNTTYPYQIEAYNATGTNRSNTINVDTPYCPPTLSFSANPTNIFQGQNSVLTWSSSYVTSCTASDGWSGSKPVNGSEVVVPLPPPSVTYTLTCFGGGGSASASATVNITPLALPNWREIIPR